MTAELLLQHAIAHRLHCLARAVAVAGLRPSPASARDVQRQYVQALALVRLALLEL